MAWRTELAEESQRWLSGCVAAWLPATMGQCACRPWLGSGQALHYVYVL